MLKSMYFTLMEKQRLDKKFRKKLLLEYINSFIYYFIMLIGIVYFINSLLFSFEARSDKYGYVTVHKGRGHWGMGGRTVSVPYEKYKVDQLIINYIFFTIVSLYLILEKINLFRDYLDRHAYREKSTVTGIYYTPATVVYLIDSIVKPSLVSDIQLKKGDVIEIVHLRHSKRIIEISCSQQIISRDH